MASTPKFMTFYLDVEKAGSFDYVWTDPPCLPGLFHSLKDVKWQELRQGCFIPQGKRFCQDRER
jgi:hypothetical protein